MWTAALFRTVKVSILAVACGCSATDRSHDDTNEGAIQRGESWRGDYAVGMIAMGPTGICTGTLIAPSVVLTAAHCVQGYERATTTFYTGAGAPVTTTPDDPFPQTIPSNLVAHAVDQVAIYPGFDLNELLAGHVSETAPDLGLLHLASPITNVPPRSILTPNESAAATELAPGKICYAVGYGRHDVSGTTTVKEKRFASVSIAEVTPFDVLVEGAPNWPTAGISDEGDSGGPLLCVFPSLGWDSERVVGTVSYSIDGVGENHLQEHYVRVEAYADWILGAIDHFPAEERCVVENGNTTMRCNAQSLEYCDGIRWRPITVCGSGQTCDATAGVCR